MKPPPSFTKNRQVTTKLVNNFFERGPEKENFDSENLHTNKWSVDWWLGFRIFPLVEHSVKDEEKTIGQEKWPTEKSWGARIRSTMWIMWIVLCTGAPPNEPTKKCLHCFSAQTKREDPIEKTEE